MNDVKDLLLVLVLRDGNFFRLQRPTMSSCGRHGSAGKRSMNLFIVVDELSGGQKLHHRSSFAMAVIKHFTTHLSRLVPVE